MITNEDYNVMYFDTDDDFYQFCVDPEIIPKEYINKDGQIAYYGDFNLSQAYNDAINNSTLFVIRDKNSQILKHNGVVSYRTISKKVNNVQPWYYETIYNKKFNINND